MIPGTQPDYKVDYLHSINFRLKCKQLFLELQNWEGEEEDRRDSNWVQAGFLLAEQKQYNFSHPLTRIPVDKMKLDSQ